jgi:hypothetical protein
MKGGGRQDGCLPLGLPGAVRDDAGRHDKERVDMLVEILIGAAVMTLVTVLFTGPGMWSSSWGFKKREGPNNSSIPDPKSPGDTKQP